MTDQAYDERDDERAAQDAARGPTERDEEGRSHTPDELEPGEGDPGALPD
jgi:hypothetical protein